MAIDLKEWQTSARPREMLHDLFDRHPSLLKSEGAFLRAVLRAWKNPRWTGQERHCVGVLDARGHYGTLAYECVSEAANIPAGYQPVAAHLLRDVAGGLFGPPPFEPAWRTPVVLDLARAALDRANLAPDGALDKARLLVLSDALEDAGCDDAEVLDHLRHEGRLSPLRTPAGWIRACDLHCPDCWALRLILR